MVNSVALSGASLSWGAGIGLSLGLVSYLLLVAAYQGFFRRYTILYMYLLTTVIATAFGALILWSFGRDSAPYITVFYFSKGPLTLFKYLVVCWLYWLILSRDYPSIRLSFCLVFLATTGIFLLYFALYPHGNECQLQTWGMVIHASKDIEKYFTTAQILLMGILGVGVFLFRVPINRQVHGIVLGLGTSFILGYGYDVLRQTVKIPMIAYLHPVPYLVMLAIFCCYLSSESAAYSQCTNRRLKDLDERLFQFLLGTHLYNRFTDRLFFGFFDGQTASDINRWKQYRINLRAKTFSVPQKLDSET